MLLCPLIVLIAVTLLTNEAFSPEMLYLCFNVILAFGQGWAVRFQKYSTTCSVVVDRSGINTLFSYYFPMLNVGECQQFQ